MPTCQHGEDRFLRQELLTQSGRTSSFHGASHIDVGMLRQSAKAAQKLKLRPAIAPIDVAAASIPARCRTMAAPAKEVDLGLCQTALPGGSQKHRGGSNEILSRRDSDQGACR